MRLAFTLLAAVWGLTANAQTVKVRSGDHPTFSRLVLTIPVGTAWTLGRLGDGYGVRLAIPDMDFDTDAVFTRIGRTRIADLTDANGTLRIAMACDCHATAFLWQPDQLVVDVVTGPAADDQFAMRLDNPLATAPLANAGFPVVFAPPETSLPPMVVSDAPQTDLTDLERNLVESVARAASQGLLEPATRVVAAQTETPTESASPVVPDQKDMLPSQDTMAIDPEAAIADALSGLPGVTAQTSIDRDRPATPPAPVLLSPDSCLPDSALAVAEWGDDRDFSIQIAERHAALAAEFDRIPAGAAEALARTYIYFGFGREARQALQLEGTRSQERNVLAAMAALVDGDPDPQHLFADQLGCATNAAFWALLDRGSGDTFDQGQVRRTYLALPAPLSGHLGNRLADIFVALDDPEAAALLLDAAAPGMTMRPTDSAETAAEVAVLRGDNDAAIDGLTTIARDDARTTPAALLHLIDLATQSGQSIDDSLMELADAMRFEHRGDPVATDLGLAQIAALLARDRFDAAARLADDIANQLDPDRQRDLAIAYATAVTAHATDPTFLRIVLSGLPADIGAEAENAAAARLLALNFPDRAAALLVDPAQFAAAAERRYLRAEAAIGMQQPDTALAALAGMTDRRAAALRSAALSQQGDFDGALSSDLAAGDPDGDVAGAWRAGAWARLAGSDDPLLQSAAAAMLADAAPTDQPPSLAAGQTALADSAATRDLIDGLLGRFAVDPEATGTPGL